MFLRIELGAEGKPKMKFRYLVGAHTVGIITPSRKWHVFPIQEVSGRPSDGHRAKNDGSPDSRLTAEEVAAFVIDRKLK